MKKTFLLIIAMLATTMMAQAQSTPTSYYTPLRAHNFEDYTPLRVKLYIDDVLQTGSRYEIGAYCGEQVRGGAFANDKLDASVYNLSLYGQPTDRFTFRLYDHQAHAESTMTCASIYTSTNGAGYGITSPLALNFYTSRTLTFVGTTNDDWGTLANWQDATSLPTAHDRVVIDADCTLANATTVTSVEVNADARLSLEAALTATTTTVVDGGQLRFLTNGSLNGEFIMKKDIRAYGPLQSNYYLISSPLAESTIDPMLMRMQMHQKEYGDNAFDLYAFDESLIDEEWQNHKASPFVMSQGEGYLYQYEDGTAIVYFGTANSDASATYPLDKVTYGYNLVGNPFPCNAVVTSNKATTQYATLNANRDGIEPISSTPVVVPPCTAIFVRAREANATVTFTVENQ